jgi:hypothetical protein
VISTRLRPLAVIGEGFGHLVGFASLCTTSNVEAVYKGTSKCIARIDGNGQGIKDAIRIPPYSSASRLVSSPCNAAAFAADVTPTRLA